MSVYPILSIIPNMGWNTGLNVRIVDSNITDEQADADEIQYDAPSIHAGPNTLIVKVRDMKLGPNRWYLGFLPEEGLFVIVPAWIFWEEKS